MQTNALAFLDRCKKEAKKNPKRIILAEAEDERVLRACAIISKEGTARIMLLGEQLAIESHVKKLGMVIDWSKVHIVDPNDPALQKRYAKTLAELGRDSKLITDRNYFATVMVHVGDADGLITGATCPTADTVRPAIQIIGTKEKFHKVSGFFFMILQDRLLLFADCAVMIDPNSHDLADIAIDTAETAKRFGIEPRIAMLSFSTVGSAKHPAVDKVREAVAIVRHMRPDLLIEGEMQVDAALIPEVCARKFSTSRIHGDANVLIFPNLDAGNISYKLVQRLAKAHAIGPILQGLKKPVNDLSRGCSVQDIVDLAAITTCEVTRP